MSVAYQAIQWNRQKRRYDACLLASVLAYLGVHGGLSLLANPSATVETVLIRALGSAALVLLHLVLAIGPLARLDRRFLPLLYNRRHLGVATFLVALAHGSFTVFQYHALGDLDPLVSLLASNPRLGSVSQFPFELLGLAALAVLFLMAATSHDFWLRTLTPRTWKALHLAVHGAYGLVVLHVALGAGVAEPGTTRDWLLPAGFTGLLGLHLAAALRERRVDRRSPVPAAAREGWIDAGPAAAIPDGRAVIVAGGGERIAVFRHGGKVSALSNVCRHQNGPLGEGRILDGCVTCPWHGYQYRPEDGRAPAPFDDRVETYNIACVGGRVLVDPRPNPPGTRVEPAAIGAARSVPAIGLADLLEDAHA